MKILSGQNTRMNELYSSYLDICSICIVKYVLYSVKSVLCDPVRCTYRYAHKLLDTFLFMKILPGQNTRMNELYSSYLDICSICIVKYVLYSVKSVLCDPVRCTYRYAHKLLNTFLFTKILPEQDTRMNELYSSHPSKFHSLKNFNAKTFYCNKDGTENTDILLL